MQLVCYLLPGVVDEECSHPRPSVFLSLPSANDERGNIVIRTLGGIVVIFTNQKSWDGGRTIWHLPTLDATGEAILCRPVLGCPYALLPSDGFGLIGL